MKKSGRQAKTIDEYLAAIPKEARPALEKMRAMVRATAPRATEGIGYGMPMFYYHGPLVSFASFKNHSSFFPMSVRVMKKHKDDLRPYSLSTGTIRFPIDKPLPAALVKKLVKARMAENEAKAAAKAERISKRRKN